MTNFTFLSRRNSTLSRKNSTLSMKNSEQRNLEESIKIKRTSHVPELYEIKEPEELEEKRETSLTENHIIIEEEGSKGNQNFEKNEIDESNIKKGNFVEGLRNKCNFKELYNKYRSSKTVNVFKKMTDSLLYDIIITLIIIFSCVILYFDIPKRKFDENGVTIIPNSDNTQHIIYILNVFFGIIFIFEFMAQAIAQGLIIDKKSYLRDPLNWIDLIVIIISIIGLFEFAEKLLILRVFRLLRIIKLIKLSQELRIVTLAVWKTIPSMFTVIVTYLFYLIIVTVIGLSLYNGHGYTCNDPDITSKSNCTGLFYSSDWDREIKRDMWRYFVGYDDFFDSLQTSFVLSNQEGWPDIMYYFMGFNGTNEIREPNINKWASVYYILSVIVGSWVFLAVVTGIAYDSIKRNSDILKGINVNLFI